MDTSAEQPPTAFAKTSIGRVRVVAGGIAVPGCCWLDGRSPKDEGKDEVQKGHVERGELTNELMNGWMDG